MGKKRKRQRKGNGGGQGAKKEKRKEGRRERRERAIAFPEQIVQKLEAGFRHIMRKVDGGKIRGVLPLIVVTFFPRQSFSVTF